MKDYAGRSRTLRKKHSKTYVDGMSSSDDEDDMKYFDPEEKVKTKDYPPYFVAEMKGEDVTFEYFQRTGFNSPIFCCSSIFLLASDAVSCSKCFSCRFRL